MNGKESVDLTHRQHVDTDRVLGGVLGAEATERNKRCIFRPKSSREQRALRARAVLLSTTIPGIERLPCYDACDSRRSELSQPEKSHLRPQ